MNRRGPAAELGVLNYYRRRASRRSAQKLKVQSDCMRLMIAAERGIEMELGRCENIAGYNAAVRNAADGPGIVEEDGVGARVDGFHGGGFGEGGHCNMGNNFVYATIYWNLFKQCQERRLNETTSIFEVIDRRSGIDGG